MSNKLLGRGGKIILSGNEAIARGALEAGITVATSYPGTPATEIMDSLSKIAKVAGIHTQWSVNEKVAFEVAMGVAYSGMRALCSMKHLGENTIIDPLNVVNYTGVDGGLVLVVADDPSPSASQNAVDTRNFAITSKIPCLEPSNGQEAKDMVVGAFELSEKIKLPVQVRITSRIAHTNFVVKFGKIRNSKTNGKFKKDASRYILIPTNAARLHEELNKKLEKTKKTLENFRFNKLEINCRDIGIIASGVSYNYVMEALDILKVKANVLKLATTNPIPVRLIKKLLKNSDEILVVEELEPIVENTVKAMAFDDGYSGKIHGTITEHIPREGELNTELVVKAICDIKNIENPFKGKLTEKIPGRIPYLCPGCPHTGSYYALHEVLKGKGIVVGDRGCYNIAAHPPLEAIDTCLCMGSSISVAEGLKRAGVKEKTIAVIGDSTFLHSGIPALLNAVQDGLDLTILILDNNWTAMTGFQPHPGTSGKASIRKLAEATGCRMIMESDPYDTEDTLKTISEAVDYKGTSVVILRRECAIKAREKLKAQKITYQVSKNCTGCKICLTKLGCPAIKFEDNRARIDQDVCVNCGICEQVCPVRAIEVNVKMD